MEPPPRPTSMKPEQLKFTPRKPVEWFSPPILARAGAKVVLSSTLGDYLDKREMQLSLPDGVVESPAGADEVWVDFVSDTGDGFDATYTVAWCTAQRTIHPDGLDEDGGLPRADFVVFGGDEVYPYASPKEYEDRFVGPFSAALPWTQASSVGPDPGHPKLLAIPGNHDWYDGLTGFMRVFAQPGWIGGRERAQTRSYFAVNLPGKYWLWGIDIGSDAYVDTAQITYFRAARDMMQAGDRLILCTAKPSWTDCDADPDAYRNLRFVEQQVVNKRDHEGEVETILMISGDKHYYTRHELAGPEEPAKRRMKITAGGGGAFLSATHRLDQTVHVPKPVVDPAARRRGEEPKDPFVLRERYPSKLRSSRLTWRALLLGRYNPVFLAVPAVLNLLLFAANSSGLRTDGETLDEIAQDWSYWELMFGDFRGPATIIILLVLWAFLGAFYKVPKPARGARVWIPRVFVGFAHTIAQVLAHALVAWLAIRIVDVSGIWFGILVHLLVTVFGGLLGSVVFGLYLLIALNGFGRHDTEAFSAFRYEGYKNFLRMRISDAGVTVYAIGIDEVCHKWATDPTATDVEASHIRPETEIGMRLIEPPIELA